FGTNIASALVGLATNQKFNFSLMILTEEVNIEEKEASNVKSGETEELDLETT
ncbi:hypothetical protein Tco_0677207, partial [Tanacetum coccineum]